jgi:hypothetical protein
MNIHSQVIKNIKYIVDQRHEGQDGYCPKKVRRLATHLSAEMMINLADMLQIMSSITSIDFSKEIDDHNKFYGGL